MNEYKKIVQFSYNNQKYNMYLGSNNKHFFLKVDDNGNLSYLTLDELFNISKLFIKNRNILMIRKDFEKINIVPKILTMTGAALLTANLLFQLLPKVSNAQSENNVTWTLSEEDLKKYISTYDEDVKSQDYYYDEDINRLYIYNMDYIDNVIDENDVSLDELKEVIQNNDEIPLKYKNLLYDYCDRLLGKYPNIDVRVFYKNLQTLKIIECSEQLMFDETLNSNCYGYYNRENNKIYLLEDNDYENDRWALQVFYHEITHTLNNCTFKLDDVDVEIEPGSESFDNEMTEEALASLFAVSLLPFSEDHISYQLQSNYYSVMVECMDYDFTNFPNKPLSHFPKTLDEYNGDDNAREILELMNFQRDAYLNEEIEVDDEEYYPIIDYLCDMYFRKYITDDMSYGDAKLIAHGLEIKILVNVPSDYNINTSRIYENLDNYYYNYNNTEKVI